MKKNLLIGGLCLYVCLIASAQKITLKLDNMVNVNAKGNVMTLIDEATKAGDPASGTGGAPSTAFTNGTSYINIFYPLKVIIDLYGDYDISSLYYYDVANSDSLYIYAGAPGDWKKVVSSTTNKTNAWTANPINQKTRYLLLQFKSPNTLISEIVLYGTLAGSVIIPPAAGQAIMPRPSIENFMGINSFVDVPDSISKVVKNVREYHMWQWDEGDANSSYAGYPNNQYAWNLSWVSGTGWGWNFDDYYQKSVKNGQNVLPCLQACALYMINYNEGLKENKPIRGGKNAEDPATYLEHADYSFQFAARYGSTTVSPSLLKLRATNAAKSGLGLIKYMENWNEPENRWKSTGRSAYFMPFELSAMTSADYDGHQGKLGSALGMKAADPNMKGVLAGLTSPDTTFLKAMIFWANYYRNGSVPFDVINFHHYCDNVGNVGGSTYGVSPEADKLKERVKAAVSFRDKYLPGKEIWFTEFGYDTYAGSVQESRPIGTQDNWEVQARWLLRCYLAYAAGGADRAYQFMIRDVADNNGLFNSCGLATKNSAGAYKAYTKKKSWYYVYTFRKKLTGYRFKEEISSGNTNVLIYAFENIADPKKLVYAVWAPTSSDMTISSYSLSLPYTITKLGKVEFANKDTLGTEVPVTYSNQKATITVDEKPDLYFIQTSLTTDLGEESPANADAIQVYPNPFTNTITLRLNSSLHISEVRIRDIRGSVVQSFMEDQLSESLNVEGLSKGVYLLEGLTEGQVYTSKVIKN